MRCLLPAIAVGLIVFAACSGGDDGTSAGPTASRSPSAPTTPGVDDTDRAAATTATSAEPSGPSTSEPITSSSDGNAGLALAPGQVVGLVVAQALQVGGAFDVDESCFNARIASSEAVDDADLHALDDPDGSGWAGLDSAAHEGLLHAYFDCLDNTDLATNIYFGVFHGPMLDDLNCVLTPWRAKLTSDLVASSLAVTSGLDDLPPSVTADLTSAMTACFDDVGWWTDDVAIRLEDSTDLSDAQAQCVAEAIVELKGVQFVIDRRLATVPVWVMPPSHAAALDLAGRCGVTSLEQPRPPLQAARGACVDVGRYSFGTAALVPCEGSHSGEVLGVFPMGDASTPWPGYRGFIAEGQARCSDTTLLSSMPAGNDWSWTFDAPTRNGWEAGDRDLTCLLAKSGESWVGPSGYAV
jgi:hypothetical protein